jgi:hypothetical protein
MGERVNLPPGCGGFTCLDGSRYDAKPGTSVVLEDHHAAKLKKSQHSAIGLVTSMSYSLGTKMGTRCPTCRFLGQAWTTECPRCHSEMIYESADAGDSSAEIAPSSS